MTNLESLQKAIDIAGGQHALAKICQTSQPRIWNWMNRDKKVPAEFVLTIEKATGVSRHELRSDLYPLENNNQVA
ncbi:transcriptional regulator [Agitococcus lubricus]|uniref:YdaS antitoxin of YdaST toxin-antitoxin system n=1 Tax=Agitococcus lubricus TaxID=1077255 RepID=A0A2T5J0K9_9GAMM|nr:helix-turn-helix domain-containing protein [Agitococcus lubricus]PTQ89816.1 YdaS antitoxin of YdaST toxin-antitoxin system [Agitococcus lubricus]